MTARQRPQLLWLSLAVFVNLAATLAAHAFPSPKVRLAAIFDMTLTVTGLYYWFVVRPGHRGRLRLAFVFLLGLLRASFAFPGVIPGRELIAAAFEVALAAAVFTAWRKSRAILETDPVARLRQILAGILPSDTAARALAAEFAVFHYAFAWRAKPHGPENATPFTPHQRSGFGDILFFVGLASLLEIVPVHLVMARWSHAAAWTLTGLSLYGALWLVAISRSLALRPAFVTAETLTLRFGLLFHLEIPRDASLALSAEPVEGATRLPRRAEANLYLRFNRLLRAERILGRGEMAQSRGVCADEPEANRLGHIANYSVFQCMWERSVQMWNP